MYLLIEIEKQELITNVIENVSTFNTTKICVDLKKEEE
jgi:hypothetical protein